MIEKIKALHPTSKEVGFHAFSSVKNTEPHTMGLGVFIAPHIVLTAG
jgi:hypothetical protein